MKILRIIGLIFTKILLGISVMLFLISLSLNHVFADGVTALQFDNIRIELYTDEKSPETEKQLTDTLTAAGIAYKKIDEVYIKEDKLYEIIYEI